MPWHIMPWHIMPCPINALALLPYPHSGGEPCTCCFGLAHANVGRVARTNVFEVMFLVMMVDVDVELLMLVAQKKLRIRFTPSLG